MWQAVLVHLLVGVAISDRRVWGLAALVLLDVVASAAFFAWTQTPVVPALLWTAAFATALQAGYLAGTLVGLIGSSPSGADQSGEDRDAWTSSASDVPACEASDELERSTAMHPALLKTWRHEGGILYSGETPIAEVHGEDIGDLLVDMHRQLTAPDERMQVARSSGHGADHDDL
jgi:hypothetical protein